MELIPFWLGIVLIILFLFAGFMYGKMCFIWRDAMLEKLERTKDDLKRIKELKDQCSQWYDCDCGKKFCVVINASNGSGFGSCECGESKVYIN